MKTVWGCLEVLEQYVVYLNVLSVYKIAHPL
jgi:hypothetical protein